MTGWQAYVLLTEDARRAVDVPADSMHVQTESYEHLSDILTWSYELESQWVASVDSEQPEVDVPRSDWHRAIEIAASPQDVYATRSALMSRSVTSPSGRPGRQRRVVHCHHGRHLFSHTITQFHPFTSYRASPGGAGITVAIGYLLAPNENAPSSR